MLQIYNIETLLSIIINPNTSDSGNNGEHVRTNRNETRVAC